MNLLRAIRSSVWMVDEATKDAYLPLVVRLAKGESVTFEKENHGAYMRLLSIDDEAEYMPDKMPETEASLVAVYPLIGMITKYDQMCGPDGTETLMRRMRKMDAKASVKGHVLEIDSGGGQAANIETVARFIRAEVKKPVIAWFNSLNASAAYYISAACDEVYASQATDLVGSIGAMSSWVDIVPYLEANGYKVHEVYADQSELKNKEMNDAEQGDYKAWKETILNPMAAQFIATMKEFRPGMTEADAYKGRIYNAADALQIGMIDGIRTFEQAVQRVGELAEQRQNSNNFNMKTQNLTAVLGALEADDKGGVYLNAEQIAALDAYVSKEQIQSVAEDWKVEMDANVSALKDTSAQLSAKVEAMQKSFTEQLSDMQTEMKTLGARPGAGITLGNADSDLQDDDEDETPQKQLETDVKQFDQMAKEYKNPFKGVE